MYDVGSALSDQYVGDIGSENRLALLGAGPAAGVGAPVYDDPLASDSVRLGEEVVRYAVAADGSVVGPDGSLPAPADQTHIGNHLVAPLAGHAEVNGLSSI